MDRVEVQTLAAQLLTPAIHRHTAPERGGAPVGKKPTKPPGKEVQIGVIQPCL